MNQRWLQWITPNRLTAARIVSIPILMVLIYLDRTQTNMVALIIFAIAAMTDYFDGILARERNQVSQMGKLLDPIADKMLVTACLVLLVAQGHADALPTIVILSREFAVSGLRQVASAEGVVIAAVRGAKWKTVFQMVAIGFLIMDNNSLGVPSGAIGQWILWAATALTVVTGAGYFRGYYHQVIEMSGADRSGDESNRSG